MDDALAQGRAAPAAVALRSYYVSLGAFVVFLGLVLLAVLDVRRGFVLPMTAYGKLGAPSTLLYVHPLHAPFLLVGLVGAWLAYRALARQEGELSARGLDLGAARNVLALTLMGLLVVDLFTYRGVQAARIASAGLLSASVAIPLADVPLWLRPIAEALNYLLVVWHATTLGILIGALFLVLLIEGRFLKTALEGTGLRAHLAGALMATPYPFCSCCAGPVGATLYRGGASLGATLAFVVASPMLNITTLSLAVALLPPEFALLRIGGGVVIAVLGTYLVSRTVAVRLPRVMSPPGPPASRGAERLLDAFACLFAFERDLQRDLQGRTAATPAAFVAAWLRMAWRLARVALPVLFLAAVLAGAIGPAMQSFAGRNDVATVVVAAALGTLLMIPTWTELAIAGPLLQQGLAGPAAALLLTLPAVSLPSMVIIGGALGRYRVPVALGGLVFLVGVLAGLAFL